MKNLVIIISIILAAVVIAWLSIALINERKTSHILRTLVRIQDARLTLQEEAISELKTALEAKYQKKVIITAYVPENPTTATITKPVPGWHCAISQALYEEWGLGGKVYARGYGVHLIADVMPDIYGDEYRIDLMVGTVEEANQIGVSTVRACLIMG